MTAGKLVYSSGRPRRTLGFYVRFYSPCPLCLTLVVKNKRVVAYRRLIRLACKVCDHRWSVDPKGLARTLQSKPELFPHYGTPEQNRMRGEYIERVVEDAPKILGDVLLPHFDARRMPEPRPPGSMVWIE